DPASKNSAGKFPGMLRKSCNTTGLVRLALAALASLAIGQGAGAQSIGVSLNVFYTDPGSKLSGGTWQLVAKTTGSKGLSGLDVLLSNVETPPSIPVGPRGIVNDSDPAGFSQFITYAPTS